MLCNKFDRHCKLGTYINNPLTLFSLFLQKPYSQYIKKLILSNLSPNFLYISSRQIPLRGSGNHRSHGGGVASRRPQRPSSTNPSCGPCRCGGGGSPHRLHATCRPMDSVQGRFLAVPRPITPSPRFICVI